MTDAVRTPAVDRNARMKRLLKIFELSANEQRVVLIIMLMLITIAVIAYERRTHYSPVKSALVREPKPSPSVTKTVDDP